MEYYPRAGDRHDINGTEITGYQLNFAMLMRRNGTHYWVDEYGRANLSYENRSKDRRLVDALVTKGLAEVHTEAYNRLQGHAGGAEYICDREVYSLLPALREFIEDWNAKERDREAANRRAADERHAAENAARDARQREAKARDLATAALVVAFPDNYREFLAAAYAQLDAKSNQGA